VVHGRGMRRWEKGGGRGSTGRKSSGIPKEMDLVVAEGFEWTTSRGKSRRVGSARCDGDVKPVSRGSGIVCLEADLGVRLPTARLSLKREDCLSGTMGSGDRKKGGGKVNTSETNRGNY